jgi:ATP-dependent RNA helicase DDX3X
MRAPQARHQGETEWSIRDYRDGFLNPYTFILCENLFNSSPAVVINSENYFNTPVTISDESIPELADFADCDVHQCLLNNIRRLGFKRPTPVQKFAIPAALYRYDLMACAQTGSGKTAAFLYPLVAKMLQDGPPAPCRIQAARPLGLILEPTRELAVQVYEETLKMCHRTGIQAVVVYGGISERIQEQELIKGADIVIATPGRLIDMAEHGSLDLSQIRYLVIDEADRMLDIGFEPQLVRVLTEIKKPNRETVMFSATFPVTIQQIAQKYLRNYVYLAVGKVGSTTNDIEQRIYYVPTAQKEDFLVSVLCEEAGQVLSNF